MLAICSKIFSGDFSGIYLFRVKQPADHSQVRGLEIFYAAYMPMEKTTASRMRIQLVMKRE